MVQNLLGLYSCYETDYGNTVGMKLTRQIGCGISLEFKVR